MSLRAGAAIVGVAESDLGEVGPGFTPLDLIGQATSRALDDAGLEKVDVDGLFSASAYYHMPTLSVGEYLGIRDTVRKRSYPHGCSRKVARVPRSEHKGGGRALLLRRSAALLSSARPEHVRLLRGGSPTDNPYLDR